MPKMLIITGPQGSGNHLFSKIFALHEDVYGWKTLLNTYWEGHHMEPFSAHWENPELLHEFDWAQSEHYVTSVSCPYYKNKVPNLPNYPNFVDIAQEYVDVEFAVIGRDQNILKNQQERVRGSHTAMQALQQFNWIFESQQVSFLSQELLYLYKQHYLEQLSRDLDWPIAYWDPDIDVILENDANAKYIKAADEYWLDFEVHRSNRES